MRTAVVAAECPVFVSTGLDRRFDIGCTARHCLDFIFGIIVKVHTENRIGNLDITLQSSNPAGIMTAVSSSTDYRVVDDQFAVGTFNIKLGKFERGIVELDSDIHGVIDVNTIRCSIHVAAGNGVNTVFAGIAKSNRTIERFHSGIRKIDGNLSADIAGSHVSSFSGGKRVDTDHQTFTDNIASLFVSPCSVDIQGILTGISNHHIAILAVNCGDTFAFDGDFAFQTFSAIEVDDLLDPAGKVGAVNGDRGVFAPDDSIGDKRAEPVNGDGTIIGQIGFGGIKGGSFFNDKRAVSTDSAPRPTFGSLMIDQTAVRSNKRTTVDIKGHPADQQRVVNSNNCISIVD